MLDRDTYLKRREGLVSRLEGGIVLLPGNGESPINYGDNCYPFRQDSTFLYYVGLDRPDLAAVVDVEAGTTVLFGDELTLDQIVWTGDRPTVTERAERAGIEDVRPAGELPEVVGQARAGGRTVHHLPPYRARTTMLLADLLEVPPSSVDDGASVELIRAVVDQRAHKSGEEVAEIERAVATSVAMHEAAIRMTRPGVTERSIAAEVSRVASHSGGRLAYPAIATIHGETLHNHVYPNTLSDGDLFLLDAGAESASGYAADLTSTWPVSPGFDTRQRDVYDLLLNAYETAVAALAPGVPFRDVHFVAARAIFEGLKGLGIMKGDPDEALAAGAHALLFPHGLGHMMGLDVHDMESLGEDYVGYAGEPRSNQFGLESLRLARELEPGFVLTVEPGIYFIPKLIDDWRARGHGSAFIDFEELERWKDFGGMRNEEDYLVTAEGARRLGPRKPQSPQEMEEVRSG